MLTVTPKDFQKLTEDLTRLIATTSNKTEEKLTKLYESNASKTEEKLTKLYESNASKTEEKLTKLIKTQFKFYSEVLGDRVEYQLEEATKVLHSENLNFKDEIISEIKDLRQETTVNSSHRRILTDHEARISKVETHLFSN